jgi:hypothetical protein
LAGDLRDPLQLWQVPLYQASRALLDGRLREAQRYADEAFATGRGVQARNAAQLYAVQLFALRAEQGRLSEVEQSLERFAREYPAAPVWRAAAAFAHAALGRTDPARRALEALTANELAEVPRDGEWLSTVALLVRVAALLGDAERSAQLGELLATFGSRAIITGRGAWCQGPVSRFAAMAAAAAGARAEAIARYETALAAARRWGAEPTVAAIRIELADVLASGGDAADAARAEQLREDGLKLARRLGLHGLLGESDDPLDALADEITAAQPVADVPEPEAPISQDPVAFYRRGDIWTIGPPGAEIQLRHMKGLTHIARLLAAPNVEIHALTLVGGGQDRGSDDGRSAAADGLEIRSEGTGDMGPVLDEQAKAAYRVRIDDLREEIEEADAFNDPERAERARDELEFILGQLAGAVGLGGRDRKTGSDAERARLNVTRAIRSALKRVSEHDPVLGRSLGDAIHTGTFCSYVPGPDDPGWDLTGPG